MITSSKGPMVVENPIVRIEAKAKTTRDRENIASISLLGIYSPEETPDAPPLAEVLEAIENAAELALTAARSYRAKFVEYTLAEAMRKRLPQADGDSGDDVDAPTNVLPFNKVN